MANANNTNPVVSGINIEPAEIAPNKLCASANTIKPEMQSVVLLANTNDANDFTVLPALSLVPRGHTITIIGGTAGSEITGAYGTTDKINGVDCGTRVAASGVLTSDNTNVTANDTVTIGTGANERVYRFKALADMAAAYDVVIGADADTTLTNLVKAINGTGVAGTNYYKGTEPHPDVTASAVAAHATTVTAKLAGTIGNSIAKAESSTHLDWDGVGAVLTSGADAKEYALAADYAVFKFTKISSSVGWMGKGWTAIGASISAVTPD